MKITLIARTVAAAALMGCALWQPAKADEATTAQAQAQQAQTVSAAPSDAQDWSRWQIRLRALGVVTDTSSSTAFVQGVPALSSPNSGLSARSFLNWTSATTSRATSRPNWSSA